MQEMIKANDDKLELEKKLPTLIQSAVNEEITKLDTLSKNEAMRYRFPQRINSQSNPDLKPMADIPFSYLRRMAQLYPVARACINRRIRQITQLDWDVTTADDIKDEKGYEAQIKAAKQFFKQPMGPKTRLREMLTIMVDDVLTLDAVCFEMQKTRGGGFINLVPVDPTTIALRVTDSGATPLPPEIAYVQIIQGQTIGEFTTDEMLYDMMNPRSYSPYGLAPLESLILQVESALRGALYNLNYFRENNLPEGFITLPEDVASSKSLVEEWQLWFDQMVAGDPRFTHRLKILPGGSVYTPAKKPEDMAFERFELWLLMQTCAMFDVQPQDIGITLHVNKSTAGSQQQIGDERGLYPLANFIKEILDDILQVELGFENLQAIPENLNPVDRKEEAEIAEKEINMGVLSGDEYRMEHGREPIGLKPYVNTPKGPVFVEDLVAGTVGPAADAATAKQLAENPPANAFGNNPKEKPAVKPEPKKKGAEFEEEDEKLEADEIRKWRRCIFNDIENSRELRTKFPSDFIRPEIHAEIEKGLKDVKSRFHAKLLFDRYLDPELKASMTLLSYASELRRIEGNAPSA
jgi:hypothetical protein